MINPVLGNAAFGVQRGAAGIEPDAATPAEVARRPEPAETDLRASQATGQAPGELREAEARFVPGAAETAEASLDRLRERADQVERADQAGRDEAAAERAAGGTPGAVIDEFV